MTISDKQLQHMEEMRKLRPENWQNKDGAPRKDKLVAEYKATHPGATTYRCAKDLGISINTARKWWTI